MIVSPGLARTVPLVMPIADVIGAPLAPWRVCSIVEKVVPLIQSYLVCVSFTKAKGDGPTSIENGSRAPCGNGSIPISLGVRHHRHARCHRIGDRELIAGR